MKPQQPISIKHRRGGFTLFEMMLVLSMLVIISTMAFPLLLSRFQENKFKSATNDVYQALANTRMHSVDAGLAYQFRFEPNGRNYLILPYERDADDEEENAGVSGNVSSRRRRISSRLPEGFTFDVEDAENGTSSDLEVTQIHQDLLNMLPNGSDLRDVQWSPPILFFPDGSSQRASFIIVNDEQLFMRLSVRELTGGVTLSRNILLKKGL